MKLINVTIKSNEIKKFKNLKNKNIEQENFIIAESERVINHIISSGKVPLELLVNQKYYRKHQKLLNTLDSKIYLCEDNDLKNIVGYDLHHGVIATFLKPTPSPLETLGDNIVVLNGITSAENVGNILRNAIGFGFDSVVFDHKTIHPLNKRCIRVSVGHILKIKYFKSDCLKSTLLSLRKNNYQILGSSAQGSDKIFSSQERKALILGSEGHGMDKDLIEIIDKNFKINLTENMTSINVASASAILLNSLSPQA